jgi:hypothetical protein
MAEAAAQFQKALEQLALSPDNPERRRQEIELHDHQRRQQHLPA